ncbi:hypothetical protein JW499_08870 [Amphritea sp. ZJ14W]|uniref:Tripartite tricarboxylate transporter TctB family protein n=1 Tax=Amphritea pacifica TaxID=2811233 RepID=A0ABS2W9Z8_9GAMM|nr:hypothetical protein [Amphritea pacifica]MBN1006754.1 hypothetical protein [Amphritea pacifica]
MTQEKNYGIYWFILALTLILLCLLPFQAPLIHTNRGWFLQPMFGSSVGLLLLTIFTSVRVIESLKAGFLKRWNITESVFDTLSSYRTALISAALFFLYINTLSVLGFVPSTLLFITTLLWMCRLLDRTWFLATLATLTVMVLIFRVGVSLWLPDVWLYSLFPESWADFANQYL